MCPDVRNHLLFGDGDVASLSGPNSEVGIKKIQVQHTRSAQQSIVVVHAWGQLNPTFKGKRTVERNIGIQVTVVFPIQPQNRLELCRQLLRERLQVWASGQDRIQFVQGS